MNEVVNFNYEKFNKFLIEKGLAETSIKVYMRTVRDYFKHFPEVNLENMNEYIRSNAEKRIYNISFVFKYLISFLGLDENIYRNVMKIKIKPIKRKYVLIERDKMEMVINNIEGEKYKTIALIQFITGARATAVIRLNRKQIYEKKDGVAMTLWEKRSTERSVFIPEPYCERVMKYLKKDKLDFPFLGGLSKHGIEGLIYNTYIYYYKALRKALEKTGVASQGACMGTHNFRVNWVSDAYEETGDPVAVQRGIGHKDINNTMKYIARMGQGKDQKNIIKRIRGTKS